jgi:imidazolonepropionase-like amidohydrolase
MGYTIVVDGRARVLAAVRQNLMQGATQIKIMGGGGGASKYDPIDVTQFTEDEIRAAVEAADDWGTYVTAHVFTSKAIKRLIGAGLKCVEHAFFADEETIKLIARKGVFVSTQTWGLSPRLFEHPNVMKGKHAAIRKAHANAQNFVPWLMKHKVKVAFGTDGIGLEGGQKSRRYELHWRAQMFGSNFEVLKQATSVAAELLALSGPRNPYPGKLGVVEEGAYADLLLVDGNPLSDLSVLGATEQWFDAPTPGPIDTLHMVMKDGVIYKDKM